MRESDNTKILGSSCWDATRNAEFTIHPYEGSTYWSFKEWDCIGGQGGKIRHVSAILLADWTEIEDSVLNYTVKLVDVDGNVYELTTTVY